MFHCGELRRWNKIIQHGLVSSVVHFSYSGDVCWSSKLTAVVAQHSVAIPLR